MGRRPAGRPGGGADRGGLRLEGGRPARSGLSVTDGAILKIKSLIVDGIIAGAGGVLVFLPQIVILFSFILVLELSLIHI